MNELIAYSEPLFMIAGLLFLAIRREKSVLVWLISVLYLLTICIFRDYAPLSSAILSAHPLAISHILISIAAKTVIIFIAILHLFSPNTSSPKSIHLALMLQSISIILGMFWAFDAPNWGSLWQWDGIETLSLCTLFSLFIWQKSPRTAQIPILISLMMIIIQNLSLFGFGLSADLSRHSYSTLSNLNHLWIISQCLYFAVISAAVFIIQNQKIKQKHKITEKTPSNTNSLSRNTSCFILAGIAILICAGFQIHNIGLLITFILIWCIHAFQRDLRSIVCTSLGIITLTVPAILPNHPDLVTAEIESSSPEIPKYYGINTKAENNRIQYTGILEQNNRFYDIRFEADESGIHPMSHIDIRTGLQIHRYWAVDYLASRGITLLRHNITADRFYELWLILIFLASLSWIIPEKHTQNALKKAESHQGNDEDKDIGIRQNSLT